MPNDIQKIRDMAQQLLDAIDNEMANDQADNSSDANMGQADKQMRYM